MDLMINCDNMHSQLGVVLIIFAVLVSLVIIFYHGKNGYRKNIIGHHSLIEIDPHEPESTLFGSDDDDEDD